MAGAVKNLLAYFLQGLRDFIYGCYKVYEFRNITLEETEPQVSRKPAYVSALAQRRSQQSQTSTVKETNKPPSITDRVLLCALWNGGIYLSTLLAFQYFFFPGLQWITTLLTGDHEEIWSYVGPLINAVFSALWVLPLFFVSKIVNALWFQDIATAAWRTRKRQLRLPNISVLIADMVFNLLVQLLILIQSLLGDMLPIPVVGNAITLLHLSLLYSLYAFEYKWINQGWGIKQRIFELHHKWPYYLGFGLPLAYLTWRLSNVFVSGCVFSILFPVMIISANEAALIGEKFDFPLNLFTFAINISDFTFSALVSQASKS